MKKSESKKLGNCKICGEELVEGRFKAGVCYKCGGKAGEGFWFRGNNPSGDRMLIHKGDVVRIHSQAIREEWNGEQAVVKAVVKGQDKQREFYLLEGFGNRRFTGDEIAIII